MPERLSAFSEISSVDWVFQKKQTKGERYYEKNSENTKRNWISGGIFFNPVSGSEQLHQSDEQHNDCYRL